jgi:AcrR family transcriptional regulator
MLRHRSCSQGVPRRYLSAWPDGGRWRILRASPEPAQEFGGQLLSTSKTGQSRRSSTYEMILEMAERLCGAQGLEAVSIRDIAKEAGISISVIYHHFKSKGNLLRAILQYRMQEIEISRDRMLNELEQQPSPSVRDILYAVLQPLTRWRTPTRQQSLQFLALALVSQIPEVKEMIDGGVPRLRRVVDLLQKALLHLDREEICWRLHFTIGIEQQNHWDIARLNILSQGQCRGDNAEEALSRAIEFAAAALVAPPVQLGKLHSKRSKASRSTKGNPRR